jgi:DNA-binding CsgD family transcriptional regulator
MARIPFGARGAAAEAAIAQVCASGLSSMELFEQVARRVRRLVPYTGACWKPLDPETLLFTGYCIEDPRTGTISAMRWRFLDNELFEVDFAKFRDLARRPRPVTTLHEATHGEPERSPRYREIHRALGFGAELRAVFRSDAACWGAVALVRAAGEPDFTREEVAFVAYISKRVAQGLCTALLVRAGEQAQANSSPAMIVLRDDLSVESLTSQAKEWLEQLYPDRGTNLDLPAVVYAVAQRARSAAAAQSATTPVQARVRLQSGDWLAVHADRLSPCAAGGGRIAVMLVPAGAAEMTQLRLELHGLTGRERQVAQLLVRGLSTAEIAKALEVSPHTLKDHVKATYAKLEVSSRAELTGKLFHTYYLSRFSPDDFKEFVAASNDSSDHSTRAAGPPVSEGVGRRTSSGERRGMGSG